MSAACKIFLSDRLMRIGTLSHSTDFFQSFFVDDFDFATVQRDDMFGHERGEGTDGFSCSN